MNILLVSGHPAQVHNFKFVRKELINAGHKVYWLTTSKDIAIQLLDIYNIHYEILRKPRKNIWSQLKCLVLNTLFAIKYIKKNKINIVISRTDPYTSLASWVLRIKYINLDDTEHAAKSIKQKPFALMANDILLPNCFYYKIRKDQMYFPGNIELFYLHSNRYKPKEPWNLLDIKPNTKYTLVRFVKWDAYHDVNLLAGFSLENKIELVNRLTKHCKVFISSEEELPENLKQYQIKIPLEKMHDVLAYASLVIGESATMASESIVLGTPAIYIDEIGRGYTDEEAREGLLKMFRPLSNKTEIKNDFEWISGGVEEAMLAAEEIVSPHFDIQSWKDRYYQWISTKIDCTAFLTWFIENYPTSKEETKNATLTFWNHFK